MIDEALSRNWACLPACRRPSGLFNCPSHSHSRLPWFGPAAWLSCVQEHLPVREQRARNAAPDDGVQML